MQQTVWHNVFNALYGMTL